MGVFCGWMATDSTGIF